jgi:hypothetical protein
MTNSSREEELRSLAASLLQDSPPLGDALERANQVISSGSGEDLFAALVSRASVHLASRQEVVVHLMPLLEAVMVTRPAVGAYLMGRLYPIASKVRDHEVYRAIELWMHSLGGADVAAALQRLANERVGGALRARCQEWIVRAHQNAEQRTK